MTGFEQLTAADPARDRLPTRDEAERMDARRGALARAALGWWQGGAAEADQRLVHERVNEQAAQSAPHTQVARPGDDLAAQKEAAIGGMP